MFITKYRKRLLPLLLFAADTGGGNGGGKNPEGGDGGQDFSNPIGDPDGDEDGDKPPKYWSQLTKETREKHKGLMKHKTIDELAERAAVADKVDDGTLTPLPTKDSTIDDIKAFYKKLGLPSSKDAYGFVLPEGHGVEDEAEAALVAEQCYKNLLTKRQGQAVYAMLRAIKDTKTNADKEDQEKLVNGFDERLDALYATAHPDKSKREAAIKADLGAYREFLTKTGLYGAFKTSGLLYDEKAMKAIAGYVAGMNPSGKFNTPPGSGNGSGDNRKHRYSKEYRDQFGGGDD